MTVTLDRPTAEAPPATTPPITRRTWLAMSAVVMATLLDLLDSTVVSVAAPAIRADLGGSPAALQWMAAGYTLALAVALLTGGRLGDMFGRRTMLLAGIAGFVTASALCAFAWSPGALIGARVLQGLCAAVLLPQTFGLVKDLFGDSPGKAYALMGPVIGLATLLGPVVAGVLVEADLFGTGWRAIFLINLPLGLYALVMGARTLPASTTADRRGGLDVTGMLLGGAGMSLLVYPLVQGHELGWPVWTFGMLAASVVVLALFVAQQLRRGNGGRVPLVELSVFTSRAYTSGVAFVIVFFGLICGFSLATGMFLQLGLGYSALEASLTMTAWAVGAFSGSVFAGATMARLGRRILHLGLTLMAAGLLALYAVFTLVGAELGALELTPPLLLFGAGMGMIFVPLFDVIIAGIGDHQVGSASAALEAIQQLAASLGVAVLGSVFFAAMGEGTGPAHVAGAVDAAALVTLLTLGLTAVAFGMAFLLPRKARPHA